MIFAAAAHFLHHVLVSLYLTLVLVLASEWQMDYGDLIALWTIGSMMVGLGAPLAGWLADRWGETRLMITLFFGLGAASILCGLAGDAPTMQIALTVLGIFGAIYHPVGNSWVVHHATEPGKAVATAGIAGSFGVAAGPVVAGVLTSFIDWRAAFILPGLITMCFGVGLILVYVRGGVTDSKHEATDQPKATIAPALRLLLALLAATMTLTLIVYTAFDTALPKFIERAMSWDVSNLAIIGFAVGAIHLAGSFSQFLGGYLADRGATRLTYSFSFLILAAVMAACAVAGGWTLVVIAIAAHLVFEMIAPLETLLVARYAPPTRRGLFFGFRYALSIVGAPAGVSLVAMLYDPAVGFATLMLVLSLVALVTFAITFFLPRDSKEPEFAPAARRVGFQATKAPPAE
jgi:MFS transporter, FSR family, fosmidomycin resistance protein